MKKETREDLERETQKELKKNQGELKRETQKELKEKQGELERETKERWRISGRTSESWLRLQQQETGWAANKINEGKHWALRPQKPLRLIRDGEVWGQEFYI